VSVTFLQPQRTGDTWTIRWTSTESTPTFRVYRDGVLIATTTTTSIDIAVAPGESPAIEVLDDATTLPEAGFPGWALLTWFRPSGGGGDYYLIEEYVSGAPGSWVTRRKIKDLGSTAQPAGYFRWRSRWLEDVTTHQFRITPVGANGNDGTAVTHAIFVVRRPDPPTVAIAWDSGTAKLTITEAA